jgi:hypothetical protein
MNQYIRLREKIAKRVGKKAMTTSHSSFYGRWGVIKEVHVESTGIEGEEFKLFYHIEFEGFSLVCPEKDIVILL